MNNDSNYEIILVTFMNEWHYRWEERENALRDRYIFGGILLLKELSTGKIERI